MKKAGILIVLILSLSFISATIDINLEKNSYNSMETLQAEITGGFIENLVQENINIYQVGSVHPTGDMVYFVKYNDKYYVYAIAPESTGNYLLRIENTKHYVGTHESSDTVEASFSVVESNNSYLSYSPGFIYTSKDFSIDVIAYSGNQDVTVEFPEAGFVQTKSIVQGKDGLKTFYISIANITNITESKIKIGAYSIPAIIITQKIAPVNQTNTTLDDPDLADTFDLSLTELNVTLQVDEVQLYEINIQNRSSSIRNVVVSSSSPNILVEMLSNYVTQVKIIGKKAESSFINISMGKNSVIVPVNIKITKNPLEVNSTTPPIVVKTCAEMNGKTCLVGESCSALSQMDSSNRYCCLGTCQSSSSSGKWVWIVLILIILGVGGWFLYNKSKEGQNFKELTKGIISKRSEDYKKRIESEPKEVRTGLTKN